MACSIIIISTTLHDAGVMAVWKLLSNTTSVLRTTAVNLVYVICCIHMAACTGKQGYVHAIHDSCSKRGEFTIAVLYNLTTCDQSPDPLNHCCDVSTLHILGLNACSIDVLLTSEQGSSMEAFPTLRFATSTL